MEKLPLVSVLVPTFNQADIILETLNSILADPDPAYEVIVGNDASTDNTAEVLAQLATQYPTKLRVLNAPKNLGITGNFNAMLAAAKGDFIALCGGDDLWVKGRTAKQRQALINAPTAGLCHGNSMWFAHETGQDIRLQHTPNTPLAQMTSWPRLLRENYIASPCLMVRKSAIPARGFDAAIPMASDWLFAIECGRSGIVYLDEPLVRYRVHNKSVSATRAAQMAAESLKTLTLAEQRYGTEMGATQAIRIGRANIYRQMAKNAVAEGAAAQSLRNSFISLQHNPRALRTWVILGIACFGTLANVLGARTLTRSLGKRINTR